MSNQSKDDLTREHAAERVEAWFDEKDIDLEPPYVRRSEVLDADAAEALGEETDNHVRLYLDDEIVERRAPQGLERLIAAKPDSDDLEDEDAAETETAAPGERRIARPAMGTRPGSGPRTGGQLIIALR